MQTWFEVKAKYIKIDVDGRERKVSETHLVDAVIGISSIVDVHPYFQE